MKPANSLMSGLGTTVFEVMSALARQHQSVNLGQGFPDDRGPEAVRRAAAEYLMDGNNQYPPMMGLPELRQAVAEHGKRFQGLDIDWQSEVLVTSGATEALGDCLFGLIEPGGTNLQIGSVVSNAIGDGFVHAFGINRLALGVDFFVPIFAPDGNADGHETFS